MTQKHTTNRENQFTLLATALFFVVLLLTAQFVPPSSARTSPVDGPEALIEITKRDLGEVFAGEELEYTFFVRNAGTKVLELKEKSAISFHSNAPEQLASRAVWRSKDRIFIRAAASTRAAPS